jgi:putative transposase
MHTMALDQSALLELLDALKATESTDVVRQSLEAVLQALIEAEATAVIGAQPHQRSETRVTQRNGYRDRLLTTAAGDLELRIPKLRTVWHGLRGVGKTVLLNEVASHGLRAPT